MSCVLLLCLAPGEVRADKRVALVIGNGAYRHTARLPNPSADARDVADKLRSLGFSVELGVDLGRAEMDQHQRDFVRALDQADVALFFYAGHGLQVFERNYLVPIDAKLEQQSDVDFEAVSIKTLLDFMQERAKVSLVFLDACRNNPLASRMAGSMRSSIGRGLILEHVERRAGQVLIAYATDPGTVAEDGLGVHSPFTAALIEHIGTPGLEIQQVMKRVAKSVFEQTAQRQRPWQHGTLQTDLYLAPGLPSPPLAEQPTLLPIPLAPPPQSDRTPVYKKWWFWGAVTGAAAAVAIGLGVGLTRPPSADEVMWSGSP